MSDANCIKLNHGVMGNWRVRALDAHIPPSRSLVVSLRVNRW